MRCDTQLHGRARIECVQHSVDWVRAYRCFICHRCSIFFIPISFIMYPISVLLFSVSYQPSNAESYQFLLLSYICFISDFCLSAYFSPLSFILIFFVVKFLVLTFS